MAALQYKTRGNSSPRGKPRVYFCCHPEDYARCFEKVSEEILSSQNCAIWYLKDADTPRDDAFFSDMEQMQLFVMPVTYKLLCTENCAISDEFRFAMSHHIPVLPLMQESGLEKLFNQKCGELQFLDKTVRDSTAIRYEEKLDKYLETVLIGDELAAKIRAAFDAYVFLSYRKKDRKYAQELMRLIHKNDFCWDFAIWYDEFLTPGENYNDSIKDALEKSKLFVLTVTPNLVNELNYITTTEYPMAKAVGMPIVPIEMVPTDKEKLSRQYPDIPTCADGRDEIDISTALLKAFSRIAIPEKDRSPQYNYLIGLAYLGGVDVEVDHRRALSLITSAADDGLPEALDKLVEMYRNGIGVERSYDKAIAWQECKIRLFEQHYDKDPTTDNLLQFVWACVVCGDFYQMPGKSSPAKKMYERGLQRLEDMTGIHPFLSIHRPLSSIYERLGDVCRKEGNLSDAKQWQKKSLAVRERIAQELGTLDARRNLSISYSRFGDLCVDEGDLSAAKDYFLKNLEISKQLVKETNEIIVRNDLSVCYNRLGKIHIAEGKLSTAREFHQKALAIDEMTAAEANTPETRKFLSASYSSLGDICYAEGDLSAAMEFYGKAVDVSGALAEETAAVEFRRDFAVGFIKIARIHKAEGNLSLSEKAILRARGILEQIAQETGTLEVRRDLSVCYSSLGDIYLSVDYLSHAKDCYLKALAVDTAVAKETNTIEARTDLAICYQALGNVSKKEKDYSAAKDYYRKALKLDAVIAEETDTIEARRSLAMDLVYLGEISLIEKDVLSALDSYQKAAAIYSEIAAKTKSLEAYRELAVCYAALGDCFFNGNQFEAAEIFYQKAIEIDEKVASRTRSVSSHEVLGMVYYKISQVSTKDKVKYMQKALNIFEQLSKVCPDIPRYKNICQVIKSRLQ